MFTGKVVTNYIKVILKDRAKSYDSCFILYMVICARIENTKIENIENTKNWLICKTWNKILLH